MPFLVALLIAVNLRLNLAEVHQDNISKFYFRFNQAKFDMKASEPLEVEETAARNFFATWDLLQSNLYYPYASANWNYKTNMTEDNLNSLEAEKNKFSLKMDEVTKIAAAAFGKRGPFARWRNYHDSYFVRLIWKQLGSATLESETSKFPERSAIGRLQAEMGRILVEAQICSSDGTKCGIALNPGITDPEERKFLWKAGFDATGKKIRPLYEQYVVLLQEEAKSLGYANAAEKMLAPYDSPDMREQVEKLWLEIQPLYKKIFSYFRFKLSGLYPNLINLNGHIPAHLTGHRFVNGFSMANQGALPYPASEDILATVAKEMILQNYTVRRMYDLAEDFFVSMGFSPMTKTFWEKSMFLKPDDGREVTCHGSAHDFAQGACGDDFRIKFCTYVTPSDLMTVHHEMGHIQYYMSYSHQPTEFQNGANNGFHEAIGDTIALSISSDKHLQKIGLLKPSHFSNKEVSEKSLNKLMKNALSRIVHLGFAYTLELWRWDVLGNNASVTKKNMNKVYWDHVERIMGVKPMPRTEEDLDPGAIHHVANGVPYIRYFISIILQHQFHETMCKAAGDYDPKNAEKSLENCDFYKSKPAGDLIRKAMQLGSSKPWPLVLEKITGQKTMSTDSLKRYYKPVEKFLDQFISINKLCIGWGSDCKSGRNAF